jgi:hypothetical protein
MDNSTLFVSLSVPQAEDCIKSWVKSAIHEAQMEEPAEPGKPKFYTRAEVKEIFNISLPTLDKYAELGLIRKKRIGNRILFAEDEIQRALKDVPLQRYKRA